MGRIQRTGVDTVVNYTLKSTSAYDPNNPAATSIALSDLDAATLDQLFTQQSPQNISFQGILANFSRFPDTYQGVMVKIKATYNTGAGEDPSLEAWYHNSTTGVWTRHATIQLTNLFVGAKTGEPRVMDFTFFPFVENIDKVWVTMNPGSVGTPTIVWYSYQLFGRCLGMIGDDGKKASGWTCDDPNNPTPGYDSKGNPCPETGGTAGGGDPVPELDPCNAESVEAWRAYIAQFPQILEEFDAYWEANQAAIIAYCNGTTDTDPGADPPFPGPPGPLPALDLCDQISIDAFRAAVSGDAEHLASFDAYITGLEDAGFFDVACGPVEPTEVYIDPTTLLPATEPDPVPQNPFGAGPGGQPIQPQGRQPTQDQPRRRGPADTVQIEYTKRFICNWSGNDAAATDAIIAGSFGSLPATTFYPGGGTKQERVTVHEVYGPAAGVSTHPNPNPLVTGIPWTPAAYGFNIVLGSVPFNAQVAFRFRQLNLIDSTVAFSVSDAGIFTNPPVGFCPAGPDWIMTLPNILTYAAGTPIGNNYYEHTVTSGNLLNALTIVFAVPRENAAQDDSDVCSAGFKARAVHASSRGQCVNAPFALLRARYMRDNSVEDWTANDPANPQHFKAIAYVLDVTVQQFSGSIGLENTDAFISFNRDAQVDEHASC